MKLKFGQTIPKGYIVEVTSWENDGDDYDTIQKFEADSGFVEVVKRLAPLFKSRCNNKGCFGNTMDGEVDMMMLAEAAFIALGPMEAPVVYKVLGYDILSLDFEGETTPDEEFEKAGEAVKEFVRNHMSGWSEYYDFRVIEEVKVYYLPEDVIIPQVEEISKKTFRD